MTRTIYLDWLRFFSIFAVVVLHCASQNWYRTDVNGFEWQVFNFYDSLVRWAVPVFVMISGCLFLNKDVDIRKLYGKYIFRLTVAFFIWSIFYAFFTPHNSIIQYFTILMKGKYHMWFIPMIIGLYVLLPMMRQIVKNEEVMKYFLLCSFVFLSFIPTINKLIRDFGSEDMIKGWDIIHKTILSLRINSFFGMTAYFVLGYYLNSIDLNKKKRVFIYCLGLLGSVLIIILQSVVAIKLQNRHANYYDAANIFVLSQCIAIFVFFKYTEFPKFANTLGEKLSQYSFGVYLVHVFVLEQLRQLCGINTLSFNPIFSVPVIAVGVCTISFVISAILNHIPTLKRYIV